MLAWSGILNITFIAKKSTMVINALTYECAALETTIAMQAEITEKGANPWQASLLPPSLNTRQCMYLEILLKNQETFHDIREMIIALRPEAVKLYDVDTIDIAYDDIVTKKKTVRSSKGISKEKNLIQEKPLPIAKELCFRFLAQSLTKASLKKSPTAITIATSAETKEKEDIDERVAAAAAMTLASQVPLPVVPKISSSLNIYIRPVDVSADEPMLVDTKLIPKEENGSIQTKKKISEQKRKKEEENEENEEKMSSDEVEEEKYEPPKTRAGKKATFPKEEEKVNFEKNVKEGRTSKEKKV